MEIVVAGSKDAVIMVEGGADAVSEEDMLEAIFFAMNADAADPGMLRKNCRNWPALPKREVPPLTVDEALKAKVAELCLCE
ncbi:MAG: hypothetical protein MZV70_73600 [Desulfobacterales bacterium]|nr:hypothetical protein [Desulfobacterales bacterium]